MNETINSIISMEKKAQEIVNSAKEERETLIAATKQECDAMKGDIIKRQEQRLSKVAENEKAIIETRMQEIAQDNGQKLQKLNAVFERNKQAWIDKIYNSVIGGE